MSMTLSSSSGELLLVNRAICSSPSGDSRKRPFLVPTHFRLAPSTAMVCTSSVFKRYSLKPSCSTIRRLPRQLGSNALLPHSKMTTPWEVPTQMSPSRSAVRQLTLLLGRLLLLVLKRRQRSSPWVSRSPSSKRTRPAWLPPTAIHLKPFSSISIWWISVGLQPREKFFQLPSFLRTDRGRSAR